VVKMTEAQYRRLVRDAKAFEVKAEAEKQERRQRMEEEAQREREELDLRIAQYASDHPDTCVTARQLALAWEIRESKVVSSFARLKLAGIGRDCCEDELTSPQASKQKVGFK
jgi:hypothetical protein